MTYEKALNELQAIVQHLQNDEINIDDLAKNIKRASGLLSYCQDKLRNVEKEVNDLLKD